jgi:hypothetical protein
MKAVTSQGGLDHGRQQKSCLTQSYHLKADSSQQRASSSGIPHWGTDSTSQLTDDEKANVPQIKCLEVP